MSAAATEEAAGEGAGAPARRVGRRGRAAVVTYGATLAILGALVAIGARHAFALERELYWTRASGWTALGALLCSLCATPVGRVLGRVRPRAERAVAPWRRALGVTAAATASLHAGLALSTYLGGSLDPIADYPWLRGGALALAILWALWLTSYPRVVRALRVKLWKPLHRLAFVAALLALQHVLLAPMAPVGWVLGVFGAAAAVGLLRLVPRRP